MLWPPAPSTNEAFQSLKTCGEPFLERKRGGRGRLRFSSEDFDLGFERFDPARDACDQSTASDRRDDRFCVRRVFQNLERHRAVTGDEIVVVERMNKRSLRAGILSIFERLPGDVV